MSTNSFALSTAAILTEPTTTTVGDGGGCEEVIVGRGTVVPVAVGISGVDVGTPVTEAVSEGKGVEEGKVGKGANVTVPKSNKAVGVAPIPWLGKGIGLGKVLGELRGRARLTRIEQRQQTISSSTEGKRIL